MAGHGELKKRTPSKAHRTLVARFSPTYPGETQDPTPIMPTTANGNGPSNPAGGAPAPKTSSSSDAKPSSTSVAPSSATPSSTAKTTSSTTSSTTTSSTTSSSSTSTSSSSSSSSTSSTSSSSSTTPTPPAPTPTLVATTPQALPTTSVQMITSSATTPTTSASATPTSTSSGSNTTVLIGGVVGGLVGLAVLVIVISWCLRRQRKHDDQFDPNAFRRQSAILVDDPPEPPRSYNPRPPTMIERHVNNASPALVAQPGYGGQNFFGTYGPPPRSPLEMLPHVGSPPPQAYGQPVMGYTGYHDPGELMRQPSNATFLNRQPSASPYRTSPPIPFDPSAQYVDLSRSSSAPIQGMQQPMSPRPIDTTPHSPHVADVEEAPLPSPFEQQGPEGAPPSSPGAPSPTAHVDPFDQDAQAHVLPPSPRAVASPVHPNLEQPVAPLPIPEATAPRARQVTTNAQRPASAYSVYEEGDAYAGI